MSLYVISRHCPPCQMKDSTAEKSLFYFCKVSVVTWGSLGITKLSLLPGGSVFKTLLNINPVRYFDNVSKRAPNVLDVHLRRRQSSSACPCLFRYPSLQDRTWQTPQAAEGPSLPVTESRFPLHTGPSPPQPIQGQGEGSPCGSPRRNLLLWGQHACVVILCRFLKSTTSTVPS